MCFNLHSFNHTNLLTFYSTQVSNSVSYLQLYCTAVSQMIKKKLKYEKKITNNLFLIVMNMCFIWTIWNISFTDILRSYDLRQTTTTPPPSTHPPTHTLIIYLLFPFFLSESIDLNALGVRKIWALLTSWEECLVAYTTRPASSARCVTVPWKRGTGCTSGTTTNSSVRKTTLVYAGEVKF